MEDNWAILLPDLHAEETHHGTVEGEAVSAEKGGQGKHLLAKSDTMSRFDKNQIAYYGVFDGHNGRLLQPLYLGFVCFACYGNRK